jgi:drug/metabolite transporter (DMT)-like permease
VFTWRSGGVNVLRVNKVKGQAARAVCVIGDSFCYITGLQFLPLADMIAIGFAGPLVVTAMAPVFLGGQVGWRRWLAVGAGFAGVLVMVHPTARKGFKKAAVAAAGKIAVVMPRLWRDGTTFAWSEEGMPA